MRFLNPALGAAALFVTALLIAPSPAFPQGPSGPPGAAGNGGDPPEYGVVAVSVKRGASAASIWARYSTRLGSPVGDTTGGAFRFTCTTAHAPCKVSIGAAVLSHIPGTAGVYPRVLMQIQSYTTGGPQTYCEYADGSFHPTTPDGVTALTTQTPTSTPVYTPVPIHIGGSADCKGPDPTPGLISEITVGPGYYDVFSTFTFVKP